MRLTLSSDLHGSAKTPRKLSTFRQVLRDLTNLAITYATYTVLILGDIFDARYGTPVEVVLALLEELEYASTRNVTWIILPGNHDIHSMTDMNKTLLRVYRKQAHVFTEPTVIGLDNGGCVCLAPWRPMDQLKRDLTDLATQALKYHGGPRVLFTHTPLREGMASKSNYEHRDLNIRVSDLHPDAYDLVLMGDLHRKQQLAPNVWYHGSVLEHTFGDCDPGGATLLDLSGARYVWQELQLPTKHPRYRTWDLSKATTEQDLFLLDYDRDDYNWVKVPLHLEGAATKIFPNARIDGLATKELAQKVGRLGNADPSRPKEVILQFARISGWDDQRFAVGAEILEEAMNPG